MQRTNSRLTTAVAAACSLLFLMFRFGPYFQNFSFDLVQHYMLVDEIMKHAGVRPDAPQRMAGMAYYPPASHWMAAVIGWVGGSGLVGITIVAVASAFACYLLALWLVAEGSLAALAVFVVAYIAFKFTRSLIGFEIVRNFFYPQLVGNAIYLGVLLWLSKASRPLEKAAVFVIAGTLAMWVQPLNALHIFGAGLALLTFDSLAAWRSKDPVWKRLALFTIAATLVSAALVLKHPAFAVMKMISGNDGWLEFYYGHILGVAILCGLLGAVSLWRRLNGNGTAVDAVLGSAALAGVAIVLMQFAALKMGQGSAYAVKKHMFIVFTLGLMNLTRLVCARAKPFSSPAAFGVIAVGAATGLSFVALQGFTQPVAPVVRALAYADTVAATNLAPFTPGNTAAYDSDLPLMANVMVSLTSFQHPFDLTAIAWQRGANVKRDVKYMMVAHTPEIDERCPDKWAAGQEFVIIEPACLTAYKPGTPLTFIDGGNGTAYLADGWSTPEPWGVWSDTSTGAQVNLTIPKSDTPLTLNVYAQGFITPQHDQQKVDVEVNGAPVTSWVFDAKAPAGTYTATIPADLVKDGVVKIVFRTPGAVSPKQLGESIDPRVLGIGLKGLNLHQ